MPVNKLASFRYRVINNCLLNTGTTWTRVKLMEEIANRLYHDFEIDKGISKRTFHYDINIMKSDPPRGFGAPIKVEDGCYRYTKSDYSIDKIGLNETDIDSIKGAVELLSHFKQLPIHSQLSLVKDKVTGQILTNHASEPIIELEHREVKGREFLTPLYELIRAKSVINLGYHSFKSDETQQLILHPYFLKQYNHRWYVIAYNNLYNGIRTYALDRIVSVVPQSDIAFNDCLNKNHQEQFKNIIGVTIYSEKEPIEIIASISKSQTPYVRTKKLHSSQVILEENKNGMKISLNIIPNYEFYSTILTAGDGIEIISPPKIRDEIVRQIKRAYSLYSSRD